MKIDFAAVGRFDEAAILAGQEPSHAAMIGRRMLFHLLAQIADDVLDLPDRRIEGVAYGHRRMLVFRRVLVRSVDDDIFVSRHGDAQVDLEKVALLVSRGGFGHHDMATRDPRAEFFETLRLFVDLGADGLGWLAVLKGDFRRRLHGLALPRKTSRLPATPDAGSMFHKTH